MPQIDMPMSYHVWDAMMEHYQRHMPKLANIIPYGPQIILHAPQNGLLVREHFI